MMKETFQLKHPNGLGSRASTTLVSEANKFPCDLFLHYKQETANLKSIMNVLALVIRYQEFFSLEANGKDEETAVFTLKNLFQSLGLVEQKLSPFGGSFFMHNSLAKSVRQSEDNRQMDFDSLGYHKQDCFSEFRTHRRDLEDATA